ncbi:MAG: type II-A CRISPR-associated protein Csn2 [Clostridiaceae bacterium]|nr:type II-A CRISPR-associated protein Csn2 [Clostridiaceae bacterium]
MKLVHPLFSKPIEFKENIINVLIVENQSVFSNMVSDLLAQLNNQEGEFVLSRNYEPIAIAKETELIINPFDITLNDKRIINRLYNELNRIASGEEILSETQRIRSEIEKYLTRIIENVDYFIDFESELDITSLLKASNIRITFSGSTLVEKVMDYINVLKNLCNTRLFLFVNIKTFFSDKELTELYKYIEYNKLDILIIENTVREKKFAQEAIRIIDVDLCEIY